MRVFLGDLAHTQSVEDASLTVPLNIGFIKAYAQAVHGDSVEISLFKHPEKLLHAAAPGAGYHGGPPDVIGLSNYGWNYNLNRAVGSYLRRLLPHAVIVAGGPNIDPEPARRRAFLEDNPQVDFLIVGAGEEPFAELLDWLGRTGRSLDDLPRNVACLDAGRLRFTETRPVGKVIDTIPSPYLAGFLDEFLDAGLVPLFETNRGCPFKCTFCAWGAAAQDLVRRFDFDTVCAEIAHVGERTRARNWIFCDANFGILKRDVDIARQIRKVRDTTGFPKRCHIWLAKNVTERNLEIGAILGDMTVPVMAVQSLTDEVLANVKRDNISTETYVAYQKRFHAMGSRTYSDLIVPLPGETRASHLESLRRLFDYGVDIILSHNMRLLAGAETNSEATRHKFGFGTRYRLIHGDAGIYTAGDGTPLRCFEYEESLRQTTTMSEPDLFYLRKLHFLVDLAWNIEVYKPLLQVLARDGVNPVDVLQGLLAAGEEGQGPSTESAARVGAFFARFDEASHGEWFNTRDDIESYFAEERNFARLVGQEFDKLNILFAVVLLKDYKADFDAVMADVARSLGRGPKALLESAAAYAFATFPPLDGEPVGVAVTVPENFESLRAGAPGVRPAKRRRRVAFVEGPGRKALRRLLSGSGSGGRTLSKILNTQSFSLSDLKLSVADTDMGVDTGSGVDTGVDTGTGARTPEETPAAAPAAAPVSAPAAGTGRS